MPPTRLSAWLLGSLCALATASCADDPAPDLVGVRYAQTYCADPWGSPQGRQELVADARAFLARQGLTLHRPTARAAQEPALCNACSCTTGVVLEGAVAPAELPAVLALGFTQ